MFIDKDSVKINNVSMGQYCTSVKFGYNKLWSNDSGRTLAGNMSGTLIGIFPKLILQLKPLTKTELELLAPIFNSSSQTVKYYDPEKKATVTLSTYTGDWEVENLSIKQNEGFQISFISRKKRS